MAICISSVLCVMAEPEKADSARSFSLASQIFHLPGLFCRYSKNYHILCVGQIFGFLGAVSGQMAK